MLKRANVLLLAVLAALSALTALNLTAGSAEAGHGYVYTDAVATGPFNEEYVNWAQRTPGYEDAVITAVIDWEGLGRIDFRPTDSGRTLIYELNYNEPSGTVVGVYQPYYNYPDRIFFYDDNVRRANFDNATDKRWLARHETGHAMALKHPVEYSANNPAGMAAARKLAVLATDYVHGESVYYLTDHDRNHFWARWPLG